MLGLLESPSQITMLWPPTTLTGLLIWLIIVILAFAYTYYRKRFTLKNKACIKIHPADFIFRTFATAVSTSLLLLQAVGINLLSPLTGTGGDIYVVFGLIVAVVILVSDLRGKLDDFVKPNESKEPAANTPIQHRGTFYGKPMPFKIETEPTTSTIPTKPYTPPYAEPISQIPVEASEDLSDLWRPIFRILMETDFAFKRPETKSKVDQALMITSARECGKKLANWAQAEQSIRLGIGKEVEAVAEKLGVAGSAEGSKAIQKIVEANRLLSKLIERAAQELTYIWVQNRIGKARPHSWIFESIDHTFAHVELKGGVTDTSMVVHHFGLYINGAGDIDEALSKVAS